MTTPSILFLALTAAHVAIAGVKHGRVKQRHNFWIAAGEAATGLALLGWGGFFS
jgi:hypothetical protein